MLNYIDIYLLLYTQYIRDYYPLEGKQKLTLDPIEIELVVSFFDVGHSEEVSEGKLF